MNVPGQRIPTTPKTTDGSHMSPIGGRMTRKDDKGDNVDRRPRQILEGHDMADDSTIQANLEAAC